MSPSDLDHEVEPVRSFDDTVIAARRMGHPDGLPLLVCPAVGAGLAMWRRALVDVARERPIVTWDLRGLHESGAPVSDRIDPGAHAEDAIAVLDDTGVDAFAVATWSNASRIGLEIVHRYPDRAVGLVTVCGAFGYPAGRLLRLELTALLPLVAGVGKHFASFLERPLRGLVSRPELAGLVRQSGFVGASADIPALVDTLREMARCDLGRLLAVFEAVAGDSAADLLHEIHAPVLLVAGERDQFTPVATVRHMERLLPQARLEVYERASHYLPIEYPGRLSDDLRKFLAEL